MSWENSMLATSNHMWQHSSNPAQLHALFIFLFIELAISMFGMEGTEDVLMEYQLQFSKPLPESYMSLKFI